MNKSLNSHLLVIVGPTASGKTALALQIAQRYGGEIICADSRTVYQGMDVGTAKPSVKEQALVPHHVLDVVPPNQNYSAVEFKRAALAAIAAIRQRGNLPILAGGSGLYIWSVVYDYQFPAGASQSVRQELASLPLPELVRRLQQQDPERAATVDLQNPRRVIRALETLGQPQVAPKALAPGVYMIGLNPGMPELERRITARTRQQLSSGLVAETRTLLTQYEPVIEPLNTVPYREVIQYMNGEITEAELPELITLHNRQLAKRQLTWFKRSPDVQWVASASQAEKAIAAALAKPV